MKIKYFLNLSLSLIILFISCEAKESPMLSYLKTQLDIHQKEKFSVIILPFDACNSCIHSSLKYISENPQILDKNQVIIYNFLSLKSSKIQYGERVFNHKNMIIDNMADYLNFDFLHSQPVVVHIENGDLIQIENLDSYNFKDLLGKVH
jgi:hypothetical protein